MKKLFIFITLLSPPFFGIAVTTSVKTKTDSANIIQLASPQNSMSINIAGSPGGNGGNGGNGGGNNSPGGNGGHGGNGGDNSNGSGNGNGSANNNGKGHGRA